MRKRAEPVPAFESEAEERRFWESHDSTGYVDWSKAERVRLPNVRLRARPVSLSQAQHQAKAIVELTKLDGG